MALSRRHFFFGTLLAGAVPTGGFGSTPSLKMMGYKSLNEKLNIASIGCGGKASSDIGTTGVNGCASTENIVALCDVDDKSAANTYKRFEKVPKFKDFRKMLDQEGKNFDACIVTIPDFMHAVAAMACMERGKHVYVQNRSPARFGKPACSMTPPPSTKWRPRWATRDIRTRGPASAPK